MVARFGHIGPARKLVRQVSEESVLLVRISNDLLAVDRCIHLNQLLHGGR
ncbi:hypothetical protein [Variovorax sp. HW608]|nr:hypothetical protein [Variovorax sp. HW608]